MERFVAGQLAALRELAYFTAPNINSYKRFVEGSFAPTAIAWGWTTAAARSAWWVTAVASALRTVWAAAT